MSEAKNGDKVKVHYTGTLTDGNVFDSSREREPLEFELGQGNMIPGFEKAVLGMKVGEVVSVEIPSAEAYGEKSEEMFIPVPKSEVPADIEPQVGQQLAVQQQNGQSVPVTVVEVTEEQIVLDANHPLAGQDLKFEIELMEIA
ncbi:MAG: FKBP-type peptidyl-prolyl cis-trans isomerase [Cyclobacteriaceae bacterium]|nr:FKBP-type peptidyl-prolyl cis-trans isomerase [Cyclobacteriaceae bacterium]MCH8516627.1 FKBP-type peptidyl-prolyl cis-trans isomerase [Cyclobacteriaceae bacterium]